MLAFRSDALRYRVVIALLYRIEKQYLAIDNEEYRESFSGSYIFVCLYTSKS